MKPINPKWQVTVQRPQRLDATTVAPGYVQVDESAGGQNLWSKSPDRLRAEGYAVPDFSALPSGRYRAAELVKLLAARNLVAPICVVIDDNRMFHEFEDLGRVADFGTQTQVLNVTGLRSLFLALARAWANRITESILRSTSASRRVNSRPRLSLGNQRVSRDWLGGRVDALRENISLRQLVSGVAQQVWRVWDWARCHAPHPSGFSPALGQLGRDGSDRRCAAAPSPTAEPSTGNRFQLDLMPSRRTRLVLLLALASWRPGPAPPQRRPGAAPMSASECAGVYVAVVQPRYRVQ